MKHRKQRAKQRERNREQHAKGQGPLLVLRRKDQEHHDQAEHEAQEGRSARFFFLESLSAPGDAVIGWAAPAPRFPPSH